MAILGRPFFTFPALALSGTVSATVAVGANPYGLAVNAVTHAVYVAQATEETVSVIDGTTNAVTATIAVGTFPSGVAVDPTTNTVYVSNVVRRGHQPVTDTIDVGGGPFGLDVDPGTHTIYVANSSEGTVSVIDERSLTVTDTLSVGATPYLVAVDPSTRRAYVSNSGDATASAITQSGHAAPAVVKKASGSGQSAVLRTPFRQRLVVAVTDQYGNEVPGASVSFAVESGSANFRGRNTVTARTNDSGVATAPTLTAGNTVGGVTVAADSGSGSTSFTEMVTGYQRIPAR